jgi:hypothetical protein
VVNNDLELFDPEEGEQQPAATPKLPQDFAVVVDAADTPQRLAQVLDDLREAGAKRIFTVVGCDGQVKFCAVVRLCHSVYHMDAV